MKKLICCLLCLCLVLCLTPPAQARELNSDLCPDLSDYISDPPRRAFVRQTIGYYLRHDPTIRQTLEDGYCAVFFFEGCSDNMTHPELKDISYYRVSAACLVLQLDREGIPQVTYYNGNCSTLPDRPKDYGPRKSGIPANIGPATILDGTYELYSVIHRGSYEALHLQNPGEDTSISAVYMTPHGYTRVYATQINIHTRNVNHILKYDMWSEGCILVGDGTDPNAFTDLMKASYYNVYENFDTDRKVGCVTLNRQYLKQELYGLYGDREAVDLLLAYSQAVLPETYLKSCGQPSDVHLENTLWPKQEAAVMSLPCSNETDARSVPIGTISQYEELLPAQVLTNSRGSTWYILEYGGQTGYVLASDFFQPTDLQRFWHKIFT